MYDLIGDIHGHAGALTALLRKLGYTRTGGLYRHPDRKAVFLGDFIDRGPEIRETLALVRPMVEAGAALAVMGNHELNALAYHTPDPGAPRAFLRRHTHENELTHGETLRQVPAGDLRSHLDWFRTLPLWLDLGDLRVVHACWDETEMAGIAGIAGISGIAGIAGPVDDAFLARATLRDGDLFEPVEILLKGKEIPLPATWYFLDKEGRRRDQTRVRWYEPPEGATYATYAWAPGPILSDVPAPGALASTTEPIPEAVVHGAVPYPDDAPPVFVGHYWLPGDREDPTLLRSNVACLDWSVARGGVLCAYRWDGERALDAGRFVTAKP